jgi:hypothetical protein
MILQWPVEAGRGNPPLQRQTLRCRKRTSKRGLTTFFLPGLRLTRDASKRASRLGRSETRDLCFHSPPAIEYQPP